MTGSPPLPRATPESAHFWEGTRLGELRLQRCRTCSRTYFPPQPSCPGCGGGDVEVVVATGRGTLHGFVISHLSPPGFDPPYVLAVVELEEGPRMLTNIVGSEPEPDDLPLDHPVEVVFEPAGETVLPLFRLRSPR